MGNIPTNKRDFRLFMGYSILQFQNLFHLLFHVIMEQFHKCFLQKAALSLKISLSVQLFPPAPKEFEEP